MAAPINDEEWIVNKAKLLKKHDSFAAKSWLIVGRTLFPRSFNIQFEMYILEKMMKNVRGAAKVLEEMLVNFSNEPHLWIDIHSMLDAVQSDVADEKQVFLRELFNCLSPSLQCSIMMRVAETTADVLQRCRLLLVVIDRYPMQVPDQGVKLVESLLLAEQHSQVATPVNCYRKYLVCDVLPLLLNNSNIQVPTKNLLVWLQKVIEFYVCYMTQQSSVDSSLSTTDVVLSGIKKVHLSTGTPPIAIQGLGEKESLITDPWNRLSQLVHLIAEQFHWKIGKLFVGDSRDAQFQQLSSMYDTLRQQSAMTSDEFGASLVPQVLYCTTLLFFRCVYDYVSCLDPPNTGGSTGSAQCYVLVDVLRPDTSDTTTEHKLKKLKVEQMPPKLLVSKSLGTSLDVGQVSKSLGSSVDVSQAFHIALRCWQMLNSERLQPEFVRLCQLWTTDRWVWMDAFHIDALIYQGLFKEAVTRLHKTSSGPSGQLRASLQLASCFFSLANYAACCETVLQVIKSLPSSVDHVASEPPVSTAGYKGRVLQIMSCSHSDVLPYCVHMLIACCKERATRGGAVDDSLLGHMIVMLQYDWPKYESLFCDVTRSIAQRGQFIYNLFFSYVVNIDMLEEFCYLNSSEAGKINLDVLSLTSKALAQARTVTRGVNKGAMEEFKSAMQRQVLRSNENIDDVLRVFLLEQSDAIRHSLMT